MNGYQAPSAGPLYPFDYTLDVDMDFEMNRPAYVNESHLHNAQHQAPMNEHSQTAMNMAHHQQHQSILSFSSGVPSFRSSDNSIFSQDSVRDSWLSSISASSRTSESSRDQIISQAEYLLTHNSISRSSYAPNPDDGPTSPAQKKRTSQRQAASGKDYFKTCVSVTKQSRPCSKEQKYFCTACNKPFVGKSDWKRHEETYQERSEMFQCNLCFAIYFLDKDFVKHHSDFHRCVRCSEMRHVQLAMKQRVTRTGWGCGFCCHFSTSWTERCNHVADHVEKEGKTIADWHHTCVIYSLLQRPAVWAEWTKILQSKRRQPAGWNQHSTGRVEGYPESNQVMQLQDALEYYSPNQDATALAQLAYDKSVKEAAHLEMLDPPPVPPKDYRIEPIHHTTSLQDLIKEAASRTQFTNSVIEDDILPTNVCHLEGRHVG